MSCPALRACQSGRVGFTLRVPLGAVCAITQYNASLDTGHQKAAWALAAGNSVVLEPSPYTAGTAGVMAKAPLAAGLPPAMMSVLHRGADLALSNPKNPACAYVNEPAAPRSPAT